ncbi:MAG TPA: hypothetical protein PLV46_14700 [Reyranella sp.]|uniref:hypothetical protein n=2 Tax=Reyranella sp. TaxID=1929291 RepID=UPI002CDF3E8E|nr:hypothetical protein [Reyranella sp.]HQS16814.1 hypothetical protein [Reyranella sp.]HQT12701.1 hypothetical protein [Reyranella sp.]
MSRDLTRSRFLRSAGVTAAMLAAGPAGAQPRREERVLISDIETATIDGRDWDRPMPGGRTVDSVHRSVLLRFPGAADAIAFHLLRGRVLAKAELVLDYGGYEIVPEGYTCREGLGRKRWTDDPPSWHVVAWPLRQPWVADEAIGPTFNASINGRRYWARWGATDPTRDRFDGRLDPQELSLQQRKARFDITRFFSTDMLTRDPPSRLLMPERCGFLLRKLETYDTRYRERGNAYEWAMPIGGHGLKFEAAHLQLTLRALAGGAQVAISLPPAADRALPRTADGSQPTARLLPIEEIAARAQAATRAQGNRPEWQLERIRELQRVGGDNVSPWAEVVGPDARRAYASRLKELLARPPRYWMGWEIADMLLIWHLFRELLPEPAQEHLKAYWTAWLQPELPTSAFVSPQGPEAIDYWRRNKDWRGRASFFRDGYNYAVSTQNFNHTAAMGALLGGAMIGSSHAMGDGRHGLENLPLRFWGFLDGSTQEMLDPYYLSITLSALKLFRDHAPTPLDRLMGRVLVDRTLELLISVYHPALRRFVCSGTRVRLSGVLAEQDGIYGALHTVSKAGVVNHLDTDPTGTVHGMPAWGYDFPPGRVAMQSLAAPWAPDWVSGPIDDRSAPCEETSAETTRGIYQPPLWKRTYLGRWHGLASQDLRGGTVDLVGQWVRAPQTATTPAQRAMLTARYSANTPNLTTTREGLIPQAGLLLTFQSRNRAIVFATPHCNRQRFLDAATDRIGSLATVIGLWNFATSPGWEFHAGDRRLESFPQKLPAGQRLFIRDGVTYLAILPLPATDLGRDTGIEIAPGIAAEAEPNGARVGPALTISLFNLRRAQPAPVSSLDLDAILSRTYGGFVLEMGDEAQHGSFEAFRRHIAAAELKADWNAARRIMDVSYRSGGDLLEAGFSTEFAQPVEINYPLEGGAQQKAIPYRRLNGAWPYLPPGIDRDSFWARQGTTGRLEKAGAVLTTEPGRKAYLIADPSSGAVVAYNPLPDPQDFALSTRDGAAFRADGKVGLMRLEYRPWVREVEIDHAPKPGQDGLAATITVSGLAREPKVTVNGHRVDPRIAGENFQIPIA